jgi:hypothetical protein
MRAGGVCGPSRRRNLRSPVPELAGGERGCAGGMRVPCWNGAARLAGAVARGYKGRRRVSDEEERRRLSRMGAAV